MVLFLIGLLITLFFLREIIRLWNEEDNVRWMGALNLESESGMAVEKKLMDDIHAQQQNKESNAPDGSGSTTTAAAIASITATNTPATGTTEPKQQKGGMVLESAYEFGTAKLVNGLPKDVRDMMLRDGEKLERARRQLNALVQFIDSLQLPPEENGGPSSAAAVMPPPPSSTTSVLPPIETKPAPVAVRESSPKSIGGGWTTPVGNSTPSSSPSSAITAKSTSPSSSPVIKPKPSSPSSSGGNPSKKGTDSPKRS